MPGTSLLSVRGLHVRYAAGPGDEGVLAISGVDLDVYEGEFVSVVGPSGCGKSTLLAVAAGLLPDFEGSVLVRGEPVRGPRPDVGIVFQEDSTFPWRDALGNVEFGLQMRGVPAPERRRAAAEALRLVGLEGFEHRFPAELSGGMRQRVAIARTLVLHPALLMMDEPFGALDEQTRLLLGEELLRIQQALGQTVLFITHNIQESVLLSDRVVVMSARPGRIKGIVPVELPRPRDSTLLASADFARLSGEIWQLLRSEALKGFNQPPAGGGQNDEGGEKSGTYA